MPSDENVTYDSLVMEDHSGPEQAPMPSDENVVLEDPRVAVSGKKNSSAKSKKGAAVAQKDGECTGDLSNEGANLKARKRTKTGCLSKLCLCPTEHRPLMNDSLSKTEDQVW